MLGSRLELPEEDVRIAEVTVGSPLGCFVSKLSSNVQPLAKSIDKRKE